MANPSIWAPPATRNFDLGVAEAASASPITPRRHPGEKACWSSSAARAQSDTFPVRIGTVGSGSGDDSAFSSNARSAWGTNPAVIQVSDSRSGRGGELTAGAPASKSQCEHLARNPLPPRSKRRAASMDWSSKGLACALAQP